jgi:uncharacterized membrane protein YfcA
MDIFLIFMACIAGFIGAMVDAIVGGGGLVTTPALLALGLPTHIALGTNKFASTMGAISSTYHYYKSGNMNGKLLRYIVPFSFIGSAFGVMTVLGIDPEFLKKIIIGLVLVIGAYTVFHKNLGLKDHFKGLTRKTIMMGMVLALALGFYDGFFGPGTGSFLIFGLISIYGFDFVKASANTRVLNLSSNLMALSLFLMNGKVYFFIGVPMGICMMLGAKVGSNLAINKGAKFIKPVFVIMSLLLVIKMTFDIVGG